MGSQADQTQSPLGNALSTVRGLRRMVTPIPHRRPIHPDQGTRPLLAHLVALFEMGDGLPPGGGRHHSFEGRSFSAVFSSMASASSRFSLAFSSSSAFGRLASEGSMPPTFDFEA